MKAVTVLALTLALAAVVYAFVDEQEHDPEHGEGHHKHHHHKHHHHKHHHHRHHHHRHHHHHHHHRTCKGEAIHPSTELTNARKECHDEFKKAEENDVKDRHHGWACHSLCTGKKMGIFDEDDQLDSSKMNELIETMIESSEAQVELKKAVHACATNHTEALEEGSSDSKCSNYKPYFRCIGQATNTVCSTHKHHHHHEKKNE